MDRARRAITSARLLLADGDINGSCNRAYYAMFDAARAAIAVSGAPVEANAIKTHSGLISAFSLCLVKPGRLPIESGKALNRVAELRLISDYIGREVTAPQAKTAIDQAETFISTIEREFSKEIENSRS
ncbi:MAG: HEPN domain-containing protein [Gammaproteobacteria bacterium]